VGEREIEGAVVGVASGRERSEGVRVLPAYIVRDAYL
jgi:hypothetical protein